jgi:hypothetical protein
MDFLVITKQYKFMNFRTLIFNGELHGLSFSSLVVGVGEGLIDI